MKVFIQETEQNIKVTSLILEQNHLNPEIMKMFHCSDCGKALFQYNANLVMMLPGGTFSSIPIINFCKICKKRYLLNSIL